MKIGDFAKKHDVTIDSVIHYMELGLLLVEKEGSHYCFDSLCDEDIQDIIKLKEYGFKLKEIHDILYIKRVVNPISYEKNRFFRKYYLNKHQQILKEIEELKESEIKLRARLKALSQVEAQCNEVFGVDINILSLLACPDCQSHLVLKESHIQGSHILSGTLRCQCGRSLTVKDGIIVSDKIEYMENPFGDDIEKFFQEYLKNNHLEFINTLIKDMKWLSKIFREVISPDTIILEPGIGYGAFMRSIYKDLSENNIYIAVDHNISILRSLRDMLKRINPNNMIILICSDVRDIPLKKSSVDLLIDIGGEATNNSALIKQLDHYMKKESAILSNYIIANTPRSCSIKGGEINYKVLKNIKDNIFSMGYDITEDRASQDISVTGHYGIDFDKKNKIGVYACHAKRSG